MGCIAIVSRRNATFLKDANLTTAEATTFAVVLLALGVISVFLGLGLMGGSRVVRGLVGLYEVLQLAGGIYTLVTIESSKRIAAYGGTKCQAQDDSETKATCHPMATDAQDVRIPQQDRR